VLLYVLAFRHFADTYYRQEVLGALVAHIGSGSAHEVEGTLDVFERLADYEPSGCVHLAVHASFIQVHSPLLRRLPHANHDGR
jgi:Fanconi anemia group D2 protein